MNKYSNKLFWLILSFSFLILSTAIILEIRSLVNADILFSFKVPVSISAIAILAFLVSIRFLLRKQKTDRGQNKLIFTIKTFLASFGMAGAAFMVLVALSYMAWGGTQLDFIFTNAILILSVLIMVCFPIVLKKLI
jgi:hypothetical protein